MRHLFLCSLLLVACSRGESDKDREIAALKAKLTEAKPPELPAPNPQPETAPLPDEPTNAGVHAPGEMTGDFLDALLVEAAANKAITYAHLKKNADKYKSFAWACSGTILEISEAKGFTTARIRTDYYNNDVILIVAPFTTDFVQGNNVDVAGYLTGPFTYESQAGWDITIPSMAARSIVKYGTYSKLRAAARKASRRVVR